MSTYDRRLVKLAGTLVHIRCALNVVRKADSEHMHMKTTLSQKNLSDQPTAYRRTHLAYARIILTKPLKLVCWQQNSD